MRLAPTLILNFLFISMTGFAQEQSDNGSQFQHQAPANVGELTPTIEYQDTTYKLVRSLLTKADKEGFQESVTGEYGFTEMVSGGLTLRYSSIKTIYKPSKLTSDTKQSGLFDPDFFINGRLHLGPGSLRFGTHLGLSIEKGKEFANGDSGNASGATSFIPFVGYEVSLGLQTAGIRFNYTLVDDQVYTQQHSDGTVDKKTVTGGEALTTSLFYEYHLSPVLIGADFQIINQNSTKTTTGTQRVDDQNSASGYAVSVYAPWEIQPNLVLLPMITYNQTTAFNYPIVDSITGWKFDVGARFAF